MIFNIAACDDDQDDIETLQKHMQNLSIKMDIDFNITIYNDSQKLLTAYQPGKFQLLFLDVEMPKLDGIELAKKIRAFPDRDVRIIFVSSYPKYMKDSFNVQAFQYLTKPYSEKELCEIIIQIVDDYKHSKIEKTIICTDNSEEIVNLNDIIAIKSFNAKKKILHITTTHKTIETTGIIGDFERKFSEHGFVIHIANSVSEKQISTNSNTSDDLYHGFGTKNVKTIVNKHMGTYTYYMEDEKYHCIIALPCNVK